MHRDVAWRALAAAYSAVALAQLYLAFTMDVSWAWVLASICAGVAVGSGIAAALRPQAQRGVTADSATATTTQERPHPGGIRRAPSHNDHS